MAGRGWKIGRRPAEGVAGFALRAALLCIALAALVFGGLAYADLVSETPAELLVANQWCFAIIVGVPVLLGGLAFIAPALLLRRAASGYAQLYLVTLVFWVLFGAQGIDPHGDVWILSITAIPAASAMTGRPRPATALYLPILGVLAALISMRSSSSPDAVWEGILAGLYDATFAGLFVGVVFVALVWTERLDEGLALEAREQVASLAEQAQLRERLRFEALVHDGVISTLLVASRNTAPPAQLALQATATLEQLTGPLAEDTVHTRQLEDRIRELAYGLAAHMQWMSEVVGDLELAPGVADAIEGATAEAVRNATIHAAGATQQGVPVPLFVCLHATAEQVEVEILDSGVGFAPEQVAPSRMGIRRSIRDRMRAVGGRAEISSMPGSGTRVRVTWSVRHD